MVGLFKNRRPSKLWSPQLPGGGGEGSLHPRGLQKPRTAAGDEFYPRAQLSGVCFAERASPWCWYKRGFQSKCLHAEPRDKVVGVGRALAASASVSARTHSPELLPEPVSPARSSPASSIAVTRGCPELLSHGTLLQGAPPRGPRHPPWGEAGRGDGISPSRWCKHTEELWGTPELLPWRWVPLDPGAQWLSGASS